MDGHFLCWYGAGSDLEPGPCYEDAMDVRAAPTHGQCHSSLTMSTYGQMLMTDIMPMFFASNGTIDPWKQELFYFNMLMSRLDWPWPDRVITYDLGLSLVWSQPGVYVTFNQVTALYAAPMGCGHTDGTDVLMFQETEEMFYYFVFLMRPPSVRY